MLIIFILVFTFVITAIVGKLLHKAILKSEKYVMIAEIAAFHSSGFCEYNFDTKKLPIPIGAKIIDVSTL